MSDTIGTIECEIENCLTDRDGSLVVLLRTQNSERWSVDKILESVRTSRINANKRLTAQFIWHREKRSLNANAYFHVLVGKIAKTVDQSESEIKRWLVTDYGTQAAIIALPCDVTPESVGIAYYKWINEFVSPKGVGCAQYVVYKPTHMLDHAEMNTLIDGTVSEAKELGIETKTPEEIEHIKSLWTKEEV